MSNGSQNDWRDEPRLPVVEHDDAIPAEPVLVSEQGDALATLEDNEPDDENENEEVQTRPIFPPEDDVKAPVRDAATHEDQSAVLGTTSNQATRSDINSPTTIQPQHTSPPLDPRSSLIVPAEVQPDVTMDGWMSYGEMKTPSTVYYPGMIISFPQHGLLYRHPAKPTKIDMEPRNQEHQSLTLSKGKVKTWIQSKFRKFVIIEMHKNHCVVLPIFTYGKKGLRMKPADRHVEFLSINEKDDIGRSDLHKAANIVTASNGIIYSQRNKPWKGREDVIYMHLASQIHLTAPHFFNFEWACQIEGNLRSQEDLKYLLDLYKQPGKRLLGISTAITRGAKVTPLLLNAEARARQTREAQRPLVDASTAPPTQAWGAARRGAPVASPTPAPQTPRVMTQPPQTSAPQTSAPQTSAPQTSAPQTSAPQTPQAHTRSESNSNASDSPRRAPLEDNAFAPNVPADDAARELQALWENRIPGYGGKSKQRKAQARARWHLDHPEHELA